jgi:hypothetical protein
MTPEEVVQRQVEAYNDRDLQRFVATYREDVEIFRPPSTAAVISGRAALAEHYAAQRFNRVGLHAEIVNRMVIGNKVIDHERVAGVREQPFEVAAVYEVIDDLIKTVWLYSAD